MRFYLSSYRLGDKKEQLASLAAGAKDVALIANALDAIKETEKRSKVIQRSVDDLTEIGFVPTVIDLRQYFGRPNTLKAHLASFKILFVTGGNVFLLRKAMYQSGFDQWMYSQLAEDIIYAGYSAGICVLAPQLHGYDLVDEPSTVSAGYQPAIIWEGLSVLAHAYAPHYKSDHTESARMEATIGYFIEHKILYKVLRDGEVDVFEQQSPWTNSA